MVFVFELTMEIEGLVIENDASSRSLGSSDSVSKMAAPNAVSSKGNSNLPRRGGGDVRQGVFRPSTRFVAYRGRGGWRGRTCARVIAHQWCGVLHDLDKLVLRQGELVLIDGDKVAHGEGDLARQRREVLGWRCWLCG